MRLPARVEDRVSIVGTCTPVLGLRNLEVVCPNRGPTACVLIDSFPLSCHGFVPRRAPPPTVIFRLRFLHKIDSTAILLTCLPAHNEQRLVKVVKVQVICTRNGSIVILLPPTHQQGSRNDQRYRMNQRCTMTTKLVLCSEPHACAQTAVRQKMIVR